MEGGIVSKLSLEATAGGDKLTIISDLSDVNRLKNLLDRIKETYPQINVKGYLEIISEKEISEDLKKYGIDFRSGGESHAKTFTCEK